MTTAPPTGVEENEDFFEDKFFLNQEMEMNQLEQESEDANSEKIFEDQIWNQEFQELPENSKVEIADDTVHSFRTINKDQKKQLNTTTIRWNGKDYPVVIRETVRYLAKHLINHNLVNGYSLVTFIGKCVTGDTRVVLADGRMPKIDSLGQFNEQQINLKVKTAGGVEAGQDTRADKTRAVATKFFKYENRKVIELITETGRSIKGTYNHPLMVLEEGKCPRSYKWKELQDIKLGDKLKVVPTIRCEITKPVETEFKVDADKNVWYKGRVPYYMDDKLAAICGYVIGDGWIQNTKNNMSLSFAIASSEVDIEPLLAGYMEELFNLKPFVRYDDRCLATIGNRQIARTVHLVRYTYYSRPLVRMLSFLKEKRVPDLIFNSPNFVAASFLKWLFEADGNIHTRDHRQYKRSQLALTSIHVNLLRDVQLLLSRWGIHSRIYKRNRNSRDIERQASKGDGAYNLEIYRKESLLKYTKYIGFASIKKQTLLSTAIKYASEQHAQRFGVKEFQRHEQVVNILYHLEPQTVYDIEVPESHSFIANGIVSHNSGSGKSTFTQTLAHYVHKLAQELFKMKYAVSWFRKKEIEQLDKIIASMEKGINRMIIFEDASFVFNNVKEAEIEEVMGKLTYIRHTLQAKVMVLVQIHYSKALEKFLRDGDLKILTSISDEEKDNFYRLFGSSSKFMIELFARKFHSMNVEGYYFSNAGTTKVYKYYTKQPFKLALVSDFGKLHFCNYHQASCEYCTPNFEQNKLAKVSESATMKDFSKELMDGYHERDVLLMMRFYFYANAGIDNMKPAHKSIMHKMVGFFHDHPEDYKTMVFEMQENGKTIESIFRDFGVIERSVTREETRKLKKADRRKKKALEAALEKAKKDKESGVITEGKGDDDSEAEDITPTKQATLEQVTVSPARPVEAEVIPPSTVKPKPRFEDTEEAKQLQDSLANAILQAEKLKKEGRPVDRDSLGFDPLNQNGSGQIDEDDQTTGDLAQDLQDINPNIIIKQPKGKKQEQVVDDVYDTESRFDEDSIVNNADIDTNEDF